MMLGRRLGTFTARKARDLKGQRHKPADAPPEVGSPQSGSHAGDSGARRDEGSPGLRTVAGVYECVDSVSNTQLGRTVSDLIDVEEDPLRRARKEQEAEAAVTDRHGNEAGVVPRLWIEASAPWDLSGDDGRLLASFGCHRCEVDLLTDDLVEVQIKKG